MACLHAEAFQDCSPAQVYASLLEDGRYHCSIRTMYRLLTAEGENRERRDQLVHPSYRKPELLATGPNGGVIRFSAHSCTGTIYMSKNAICLDDCWEPETMHGKGSVVRRMFAEVLVGRRNYQPELLTGRGTFTATASLAAMFTGFSKETSPIFYPATGFFQERLSRHSRLRRRLRTRTRIYRSVALEYLIVVHFLETGLVPRFPTAILATGLSTYALIMFACGFVLDNVTNARRETRLLDYLRAKHAD
jgi:hypothetical protein